MDPNFRENLESQRLPLFTRTPPRTPLSIPSLPQPNPGPPAPPPRALPPASPASPGRCFSLAEPSPTRVAACSRELIPAGRSRRLPGPAAPLREGAPRPALRSRPARPAALEPLQPLEGGGPGPRLAGPPAPAPPCPAERRPTPSDRPPHLSRPGRARPALAAAARPLPLRVGL